MKRLYLIILTVCMIGLSTGCANYHKYEDTYTEGASKSNENIEETIKYEGDIVIIDSYAKELSGLNEAAVQRKAYMEMSANDKGLYVITSSKQNPFVKAETDRIYYYDIESGLGSIWCSDLTCTHNNVECTACLYEEYFYTRYVIATNEHVYLVSRDDKGAYLEQYNLDGTNRIRLTKLWDINTYVHNEQDKIPLNVIKEYNGTLYYFVSDNYKELSLYSLELSEGAEPKLCWSQRTENGLIGLSEEFIITEEYVLFSRVVKENEERTIDIVAYGLADSEVSTHPVNAVYYGAHGDYVYYPDADNTEDIMSYNLLTGNTKKCIDMEVQGECPIYYYYIVCTDNYIITDNKAALNYDTCNETERHLRIYDYDWNIVSDIIVEKESRLILFDERIIMLVSSDDKTGTVFLLGLLDENMQIKEWIKMKNMGNRDEEYYQ